MPKVCKLVGCDVAIAPDKEAKGHLFCSTEHRRAYRALNPSKPRIKHPRAKKPPKEKKGRVHRKKTTLKPHEVLARALEAGLTVEQLLRDPSLALAFE